MSESRKQGRPRRRRGRLLVHLFTLALLGVGLLSVGAVTGLAADATISTSGSIGAYSWSPSEATVNAGGTVEFKNMNGSHAVAWEPSNPETPTCPGVPSAGSASWSGTCTFQAGGTYKFYCPVHPTEMKGTITVNGPSTPVATTGTATAVSDTGATLNGSVNPNGQATSYYFEYGTSTAYGTKTTEEALGEGTAPIAKSAAVSGLTPSTTYHFRIVAKYGGSATKPGEDRTFSTTGPPSATTEPATGVGGSEATLAGTVNARGIETKYFFEYGTNGAFGQKTAEKVATGTSNVAASAKVTGLSVNTAYQFRLVAKSTSGESKGVELTFTTRGPPKAITGAASGVGNTAATLAGVVNPEGQQTAYFFEYGTSEAYGQKTPEAAAGKGTGDVSVSTAIADLAPGTPYHFKLVAKSSAGTTSGTDQTFTTSSTPPPPPPPAEESSPPPPPPPPGAAPPDTRITKKPTAKTRDRTPTVKFAATVAGASYLCSVDSKPFKACRSPFTAPSLRPGRHRIRVKAVAGGAADPTPAACSFKVLGKKR